MQVDNQVKNQDLISVLQLIKESKVDNLRKYYEVDDKFLEILEKMDLISRLSSGNLALTSLGESILNLRKTDVIAKLDQQEKMMHLILHDLQNIKSALASLTLESFRNPVDLTTFQEQNSLIGNQLSKNPSTEKDVVTTNNLVKESNDLKFTTEKELLEYYGDIIKDLKSESKKTFLKTNKNLINNFEKLCSMIDSKELNTLSRATFESFLYFDTILNYFLKLNYEDITIEHENKSLLEKAIFLKNFLPFKIKHEVLMFLDEFKKDYLSSKELKIGTKTFDKIFQELQKVHEKFIMFIEYL